MFAQWLCVNGSAAGCHICTVVVLFPPPVVFSGAGGLSHPTDCDSQRVSVCLGLFISMSGSLKFDAFVLCVCMCVCSLPEMCASLYLCLHHSNNTHTLTLYHLMPGKLNY